jgi:glucose/arabinose dehydrogenase
VRRFDPATQQIHLVAGMPPKPGNSVGDDWTQTHLRRPHGARIAPDGRLLIADSDNDRILIGRYSP